jgi:hypothetical protein
LLIEHASQKARAQTRGFTSDPNDNDDVDVIVNEALSAPLGPQRDALYTRAVMLAARKDKPDQALSLVDKMFDKQQRFITESIVRYQIAVRAIVKDDVEGAYRYARNLPDLYMKTMAYVRIAQSLVDKKESERATSYLNDLEQSVVMSDTSPEKAKELVLIAEIFAKINKDRAYESLRAAVGAINAADFSYKDSRTLSAGINSFRRGSLQRVKINIEELGIDRVFLSLSAGEFDKYILLAQSIDKPEASILSQLAVCREVLSDKSKQAQGDQGTVDSGLRLNNDERKSGKPSPKKEYKVETKTNKP